MPRVPTPKKQKEPGGNARILKNAIASMNLPEIDIKDVDQVRQRMSDYLQFCIDHDVYPSITGCANWLNVQYRTLEEWYSGRRGSIEHQKLANRFYMIIQDAWAQSMNNGEMNPVSGIYLSKVFFGYRDTQEIVVTTKAESELSLDDLIAQSKMLPGASALALPSDYESAERPVETVAESPAIILPSENDPTETATVKIENVLSHEGYMKTQMETEHRQAEQQKLARAHLEYLDRQKAQKEAQKAAESGSGENPDTDNS